MKTILCVEDDKTILANNKKNLTDAGFNVLTAETVAEARKCLAVQTPDAIVLDIMLPDGNGLEYLKELRQQGNNVPVLMLTAWNRNANIAQGLEAGADDYIGKPFGYDVLLARVKNMLAHAERVPETVTRGLLTLKLTPREAYVAGENLMLTPKEFALLLFFIQNENRVMTMEQTYESVWGQPMAGDSQALKIAVSRLRKGLAGCGYSITSEYGSGYCFERG